MALYTPKFVIPDMRSGLGLGIVDVSQGMTVSWKITGPSALQSFSITIYTNDSASLELYTTGRITTGCPAYGTTSTGESLVFSYTISAGALSTAGITNGNEYKLIIKQWWSASDSITQNSASVFVTRAAPTLSIAAIGTGGVISTRYYTFTGNYYQVQGDVLNWFRWRIAYANDLENPLYDSGNISGTMDISCYYDGFFNGGNYSVRLTIQTENGIESDTGWVNFSASYSEQLTTGTITASCVKDTDAIHLQWNGVGSINGVPSGYTEPYYDWTTVPQSLYITQGSQVTWSRVGTQPISFSSPWSVIWTGNNIYNNSLFRIKDASNNEIDLEYTLNTTTLALKRNGTTIVSQGVDLSSKRVTVILTENNLYIRAGTTTYTLSASYTQGTINQFVIPGPVSVEYFEVISGTPNAATITAAITNGTYVPQLDANDYMMADFSDESLDAETLTVNGDTIQGYSLYRRQGTQATLLKVGDAPATANEMYDYGTASQTGPFTYYLFPIGTSTYIASAIISQPISPCWWNYTLMECAATSGKNIFSVIAAYRFSNNIETGNTTNNNKPNVLANFTPYPKVQLSPQNYKSGSLTGLIGSVKFINGKLDYVDTLKVRNELFALSKTQNSLFLKTRKGELIQIRISEPISISVDDATAQQTQTATISWVEVADASATSLYATGDMERVGI